MNPTEETRGTDARDALTRRLERRLEGLLSRRGVTHAIIALERIDGSFRWIGAAGEAKKDGPEMAVSTPFFIASVDKLFTATVVLKLSEKGLLDLDASMSSYLPGALVGGLHRLGGVHYTSEITVRHLLSHTSGLPDWLEDRPKGCRSLAERLVEEGDIALSVDELLHIVRDRLTPHFPPQPVEAKRPRIRYCDTNYILLAAIIEAVTGQPLHEVHENFLFQPLSMRHTWVAGHSRPSEPTPEPSTLRANDEPLDIPLLMRSIRGIYSTAEDTLRFLRALTRGDVFDDPATWARMQASWNRFGFPRDRAALRAPSWPIQYALGVMRFHDPILDLFARWAPSFVPIHPPPTVIGHTGSTGSWLFHCPHLDLLLAGTVDEVSAGVVPFRLVPKLLFDYEHGRGE